MRKYIPYLVTALLTILVTLAIQNLMLPMSFKTFDAKATIDSYQSTLATKGASPDEQVKLLSRFVSVMNTVTESYAAEHNVVIIVSAAHVAGAEDITSTIQQEIVNTYKDEK